MTKRQQFDKEFGAFIAEHCPRDKNLLAGDIKVACEHHYRKNPELHALYGEAYCHSLYGAAGSNWSVFSHNDRLKSHLKRVPGLARSVMVTPRADYTFYKWGEAPSPSIPSWGEVPEQVEHLSSVRTSFIAGTLI
tara:strand:- start:24 stop:428 length:405 start_codon:yes stop_codon:yes gene_type:complete